jgi:hypothetical protein
MNRWQIYAVGIPATLLGGLAASAAIGHQSASAAPSEPELVTSVAIPPIPVSGTVSANQAGAWNVGLLGTPSVTIANTPTVTLSNSAALALFIRNADEPGRVAYQSINELSSCGESNFCQWQSPPVPAGHRLVVQHIAGSVQTTTVPNVIQISVQAASGAPITGTRLAPPYLTDTNYDIPVQFYVDAGQFYVLQAYVDPSSAFEANPNEPPATFTATGYLLDCTAAPCAAIAQ